jgi:hypothetical protein
MSSEERDLDGGAGAPDRAGEAGGAGEPGPEVTFTLLEVTARIGTPLPACDGKGLTAGRRTPVRTLSRWEVGRRDVFASIRATFDHDTGVLELRAGDAADPEWGAPRADFARALAEAPGLLAARGFLGLGLREPPPRAPFHRAFIDLGREALPEDLPAAWACGQTQNWKTYFRHGAFGDASATWCGRDAHEHIATLELRSGSNGRLWVDAESCGGDTAAAAAALGRVWAAWGAARGGGAA